MSYASNVGTKEKKKNGKFQVIIIGSELDKVICWKEPMSLYDIIMAIPELLNEYPKIANRDEWRDFHENHWGDMPVDIQQVICGRELDCFIYKLQLHPLD